MPKTIYDYVLKFIIIGDTSVGKSNVLSKFINKQSQMQHELTIGVEFSSKIISRNNAVYKLQIWDTAGQEIFKSMTKSYYRDSVGCLIVYDITQRKSFESVTYWMKDLKKNCNANITIILIGNKTDLDSSREVSTDEGKEFANNNNIAFFETSVMTFENINLAFLSLIDQINNKIINKKIDITNSKNNIHLVHQEEQNKQHEAEEDGDNIKKTDNTHGNKYINKSYDIISWVSRCNIA